MYWANELANQDKDADLKEKFSQIAEALSNNETAIVDGLNTIQGQAVNIDGYYQPNEELTSKAMRPNNLLNNILASL